MDQIKLIDKSRIEEINSRLAECHFVKSDSSKAAKFENWELNALEKEDKKLSFLESSDEDDDYGNMDQTVDINGGPHLWQNLNWEKDIIYNNKKINAIDIMELTWELQKSCLSPISHPEIRLRRVSTKKSVFDFYPVNVHQNRKFLSMDRAIFPLFVNDTDDNISHYFKNSVPTFTMIKNGEVMTKVNIDQHYNESLSVDGGNVVIYESSEQHAPFRMQTSLTSLLISYGTDDRNQGSTFGVPKIIDKKSPFLGALTTKVPYQLSLENKYFRVPLFEHKVKTTDFLLIFNDNAVSVRNIRTLFLGAKQMPLILIPNPKCSWFKNTLLKIITQVLLDNEVVSADILGPFLSNFDFLNLKADLQKIAILNNQKFWKLKPRSTPYRGMDSMDVNEYMMYMSISSYITSYGYVEADLKRRKALKQERKKEYKNACSPWAISKAYINGAFGGFWKLSHFETPIARNQMQSYLYLSKLVQKKLIDKSDLRKLTMYEVRRLLTKLEGKITKQGSSRWKMVQDLSAMSATYKDNSMIQYARESKHNKKLLRKKYEQQCADTFDVYREAMSNPVYPVSDNEALDNDMKGNKEISVEEFLKSIKTMTEVKPKKLLTVPLKRCSENSRKLLSEPAKYMIIYRKKENVVEKTKLVVNEIVLEYLRQTKQGSRNLKTIYGISEDTKYYKQRLRDKKRRQDVYIKKRLTLNLPVDPNTQDTTDKICSSCGAQGHIRTNQECPNFGRSPAVRLKLISSSIKEESVQSSKSVCSQQTSNIKRQYQGKQVSSSIKEKSMATTNSECSQSTSNIQKQYQSSYASSVKRKCSNQSRSSNVKIPRLKQSNPKNMKGTLSRTDSLNSSGDDEFVLNIPQNLINQLNNQNNKSNYFSPIKEIKKEVSSNTKRQKISKKNDVQFSGCMAPCGGGIVYQNDDKMDACEIELSKPVGKYVNHMEVEEGLSIDIKKENFLKLSDSDDDYIINIGTKLTGSIHNSESIAEVTRYSGGSDDEDSNDLSFTINPDLRKPMTCQMERSAAKTSAIKSLLKGKGYFKVDKKLNKPKQKTKISLGNITNVSTGVPRPSLCSKEDSDFIINIPPSVWQVNVKEVTEKNILKDIKDTSKSPNENVNKGIEKVKEQKIAKKSNLKPNISPNSILKNVSISEVDLNNKRGESAFEPERKIFKKSLTSYVKEMNTEEDSDEDDYIINIPTKQSKLSQSKSNHESDTDEEFIINIPQRSLQKTECLCDSESEVDEDFIINIQSFPIENIIKNHKDNGKGKIPKIY